MTIIYMSDKYRSTESDIASRKMLDAAGVTYSKMNVGGDNFFKIDFFVCKIKQLKILKTAG